MALEIRHVPGVEARSTGGKHHRHSNPVISSRGSPREQPGQETQGLSTAWQQGVSIGATRSLGRPIAGAHSLGRQSARQQRRSPNTAVRSLRSSTLISKPSQPCSATINVCLLYSMYDHCNGARGSLKANVAN